jgi:probable HAF family extracellular repeat protein
MMARRLLVTLCVSILLASGAITAEARQYKIIDLGSEVYPYAINDNGDYVGTNAAGTACLVRDGVVQELGTFGQPGSTPRAVNNDDEVVGSASAMGIAGGAFLWQAGVMQNLGTLGGSLSAAVDINGYGDIAGWAEVSDGQAHACLWHDGAMQDLGTLGGVVSGAMGTNEKRQVVGSSDTAEGLSHAFLWQDGVMQDLGTIDGNASSGALKVNDSGQVVGRAGVYGGYRHAFLWENGTMRDLGTLSGKSSSAEDINNSGVVVGYSDVEMSTANCHAFVWESGVMQDLGALEGYPDSRAFGINELGQIIGECDNGTDYRGVIWEPVPEPSSLAILAAGLLPLGVGLRRRKLRRQGAGD